MSGAVSFEDAKLLQSQGSLDEAAAVYRRLRDADPGDAKVLNNLGSIYEAQGELDDALRCYMAARALSPNTPTIEYNLAHVLYRQGNLDAAIDAWRQLIATAPDDADARYNLGNALFDKGDLNGSLIAYMSAIELRPDFFHAYSNLGAVLFEQRRFLEAETMFRKAISIDMQGPDCFNLAKVLELRNAFEEAEQYYRHSLELLPDSSIARERLAYMHARAGQTEKARQVVAEWIERMPDHPVARHFLGAYSDQVPGRATDEYVRAVFDTFADDFDKTLNELNYRAPALVAERVAAMCPSAAALTVLDAGCGTGLSGVLLRPYAKTLHGVDLSSRMLEKATARGIFDELCEQELTEFLSRNTGRYDLIVACDTLNYFGDLGGVFTAAANALTRIGRFIFSLEEATDRFTSHALQIHGRYTHGEDFVRRELERHGFEILTLDHEVLRHEGGDEVKGLIVAATRSSQAIS